MSTRYTGKWYATQRNSAYVSARAVVPVILDLVRAARVVDVGCGTGAWLANFVESGVKPENVLGLDGDYVDRQMLMIPAERFEPADLSKPQRRAETFDLVISLEVGEHLPASSAAGFVEFLTSLGPVVLFSAAVPKQGGNGHLNERWPAYWARFFRECGFVPCDALRKRIWHFKDVDYFYQQNPLFYVKHEQLANYPKLERDALADDEQPIAMIHPTTYFAYYDLANSSIKRIVHSALRRVGLSPMTVKPPDIDCDR